VPLLALPCYLAWIIFPAAELDLTITRSFRRKVKLGSALLLTTSGPTVGIMCNNRKMFEGACSPHSLPTHLPASDQLSPPPMPDVEDERSNFHMCLSFIDDLGLYWHDDFQSYLQFPAPWLPDSIFGNSPPGLSQLPDMAEPLQLKQNFSPVDMTFDRSRPQFTFSTARTTQNSAQTSPATPFAKRQKTSACGRYAKTGQATLISSPLAKTASAKSISHTTVSVNDHLRSRTC
jgi:hypothetical protein